jgi:hypothetical protein
MKGWEFRLPPFYLHHEGHEAGSGDPFVPFVFFVVNFRLFDASAYL